MEKNTRTALTTIEADSVSKNSSWLSSREFSIQLLCVCPRSKEHTQPIPGQSKSPYILEWVTHCVSLASHFGKKMLGKKKTVCHPFKLPDLLNSIALFQKPRLNFDA